MPRKTNGIEFELHPSPKRDEEGKPLLYARPASGRKKTMKQLDDFCAEYRNLQKGEMERLFNLFLDVAGNWLSQGYRVETPIGSLSIKLKLVGEHSDPDKVTGRDILYNGVEFTPSKELVEKANINLRREEKQTAILKRNTYFVLDEFGNLPKFENMEGMVTVARSRGIRFLFVLQSFSQLTAT